MPATTSASTCSAACCCCRTKQRAVLLLVALEDLSYGQVAKVLAIPAGTVMSRLSRARSRLRELMDSDAAAPAQRPNLRRLK